MSKFIYDPREKLAKEIAIETSYLVQLEKEHNDLYYQITYRKQSYIQAQKITASLKRLKSMIISQGKKIDNLQSKFDSYETM